MPDKVLLELLLVLTCTLGTEAMGNDKDCRHPIPDSCVSNTNIQLTQQTEYYGLQLCSNGRCIPEATKEKWIKCDQMCDACNSMAGRPCGTDEEVCERQVSTFLDNYCSNNLPSTSTTTHTTTVRETETTTSVTTETTTTRIPTTTSTNEIVTSTVTHNVTVTITTPKFIPITHRVSRTLPCQTVTSTRTLTASPTCGVTTSENYIQTHTKTMLTLHGTNIDELAGDNEKAPVAALGALLGLFMILLAIVTAGWVWTLCAMKRKKSEKAASKANVTDRDSTTERCFQNPTYEMKTTAQEPPKGTEVTYDVVASPGQTQPGMTGNGQTYAKLNRPKRNGHKPPRGMPSQQLNDDYSQLGLVNEDAENNYSLAGWEREGGQGGGDYADPDMEAEMVGGATEYEVPVPLRKSK